MHPTIVTFLSPYSHHLSIFLLFLVCSMLSGLVLTVAAFDQFSPRPSNRPSPLSPPLTLAPLFCFPLALFTALFTPRPPVFPHMLEAIERLVLPRRCFWPVRGPRSLATHPATAITQGALLPLSCLSPPHVYECVVPLLGFRHSQPSKNDGRMSGRNYLFGNKATLMCT